MLRILPVCVCLFCANVASAAPLMLTAEQWAVPRDAASVSSMPVLQQTMFLMADDPASRLRIRYPGGDEGMLWVNELKSWLVALGLPSSRIEISPGSTSTMALELEVLTNSPASINKP